MAPARSLLAAALGIASGGLIGASGASAATTTDVSYDLGSPPAQSQLNALDLYTPDAARPGDRRPVVVYVHGGGWATGDKSNRIADKAALFTGAGYVFASVNYRLSPEEFDPSAPDPARVRFPDHPDDVGEAIGWLDRNVGAFGGDRRRIVLIGHSAGAHLVSLVSTDPRYLRAHDVDPLQIAATVSLDTQAFDVPGRIAEIGPQGQAIYFNAFATPEENAADGAWDRASPLLWADSRDARHLLVTQAGSAARVAENQRMAAALGQPSADVVAVPYDHAGINLALGAAEDPAGETAAVMAFVARELRASRPPRVKLRAHPRRVMRVHGERTRVRFAFGAGRPGQRYECRLDRRRFRRCRSPERFRLKAGRHRFRVRAVSTRGHLGEVTAFAFRVKAPARAG